MKSLRRAARAVIVVLTLIVSVAASAIIVSQTAWFRNRLRDYLERQATQYLNGTVSIERLRGNLFQGVGIEHLAVSMDGAPVASVEDIAIDYNVFELAARGLTVNHIRLRKPMLYLRHAEDGWSIARLVKTQRSDVDREAHGGSRRRVIIDGIVVSDGTIIIEGPPRTPGSTAILPRRIDRLDATLAFRQEPGRYAIDVSHMSLQAISGLRDPVLTLKAFSGSASVTDDTIFLNKVALETAESSLAVDGEIKGYSSSSTSLAGPRPQPPRPPNINLRVRSARFSMPEVSAFVPSLNDVRLRPAFELEVDGPLDRLGVNMSVRDSAGQIAGRLVAGFVSREEHSGDGAAQKSQQSLSGELSIRRLDLAPILNDARLMSDITAETHFSLTADDLADIASARGTASVNARDVAVGGYAASSIEATARLADRRIDLTAKAAAYGANLTTRGQVTLPAAKASEGLALDVRGEARNLDLRRIPRGLRAPQVASDINVAYHVVGVRPPRGEPGPFARDAGALGVTLTAQFLPSRAAGADIANGSTASVSLKGGDVAYRADVTLAGLDLRRVGALLELPALETDRYATAINGHVEAVGRAPISQGPQALPALEGPRALALTANGTLSDSVIMGGRVPRLTFNGSVLNNTAHINIEGTFEDVDPAILSEKSSLKGAVGGHLGADATVHNLSEGVTLDAVQAVARVDIDPSTVGGLEITHAALDGDYSSSTVNIKSLEVTGRDVNVTASGRLAVGDAQVAVEAPAQAEGGQSNLKIHAESPNLATIARLFDQPLSGVARLDATVTGNRREYRASGNASGDDLKFDRNGALNATTDFQASLTALDPATATISGTSRATLVTIAGQNLNEVTARTRYAHREIEFDVAANQPERSLTAEGSLLLPAEGVEVLLTSLALRIRDAEWQAPAGTRPAIQYSADTISVADLQLSSGQQNISVDGKFGGTGDTLNVMVADLDVATIDQLLLRQPQSSGRLNASAKITGTRAAPSVTGDFAIAQGGLRQLRYDRLGGTVSYENNGIDIDIRLQQNPTTWMVVKGYAPLASDATRTDYDLHIDSSPIELGLLQPLIPSVTNLTGTLQAKVDVTGPSGDPHPLGAVTIANGSFKVLPTGVSYSQLEGRIDLLPEKVHIGELGLADSRGKRLTITGDLAIREREVAGVAIEATANDFRIVDNKMGSLRINTNLRIAGELGAPRIDGDLAISTGQINLDPIVAAIDDAAYATQESALAAGPDTSRTPSPTPIAGAVSTPISGGASTGGEASRGVFDPLQMYVRLTAPNALVIKANDLRAPGARIGLGALNVTVGSDVYISKSPWDQVRLLGTVNTVRGTYDFQGRRFTILRDGRIRFEGLDDLDAALDIRAERVIQGVTTNVNIRGRLTQPELALSSTPPLEEADILALIVFNQPINQLGEGQQASLSSIAGSMALGAATGPLAQSIGNALNLNTFELNVAPQSGVAADITVGQQIGQNLYVKLDRAIGDLSQTNLVLEYELTRWLRFRTNYLQGSSAQTQLFQRTQSSGVDVLFFFSY